MRRSTAHSGQLSDQSQKRLVALRRRCAFWVRQAERDTGRRLDAIALDGNGNVWVREFVLNQQPIWYVFSAEGNVLAKVVAAPLFDRIFQITDNRIVGLLTDPDGLESVAVHRFDRNER